MRCLFVVCLITGLSLAASFDAYGLSDVEKGIFELEHIGLQVQAVEIEMGLYLAKEAKDSPMYEEGASIKPARKAVEDLSGIKNSLSALVLPQELAELKPQYIGVIDKLAGIYSAVSKKSNIDLGKEHESFWVMVEEYNKSLIAKIDLFLEVPKGLQGFDILAEEAKLFQSPEDKDRFIKADNLIKEEKYKEAAAILKDLLARHKDTAAEGSVISRIADCYEMGSGDAELGDIGYALGLLNEYVTVKKKYSPNIQRIYLQWKVIKQFTSHGLSNWSEIPNDEYIAVLWDLVRPVEQYVETHPDDKWAKLQLLLLMDAPLIYRWPENYQYGNSVAINHYYLWKGKSVQKAE